MSSSPKQRPPYDWSRFTIHMRYSVPPKTLFRAWATSGGLESFFIEKAAFHDAAGKLRSSDGVAEKGDRYEWRWTHGATVAGRVLRSEDNLFEFTFGEETKVKILIKDIDNGSLLELVQYDMPTTPDEMVHNHLNCRGGWIHFLVNLKAVLEHGIDVRERDPRYSGSLATHYKPPETAGAS